MLTKLKTKKISSVHVLSSLDNPASGVGAVVPRLAESLDKAGVLAELIALGLPGSDSQQGVKFTLCQRDRSRSRLIAKLGRSRAMRHALSFSSADVFHTHGMWMMPNVYPAEAANRANKPFLLSPHGMLGPEALQFSRTAKQVFWSVWQKRAAECVACFHATAKSEYEDIRAFGLKQPVAIVPNGIDLPDLSSFLLDENKQTKRHYQSPFILSLGRIHPKKGLDRLVSAFALVAKESPEWRLRIVGPDERGHAVELNRQVAAMNLVERVSIEPPVYGDDKLRLMRQAEFFALPTLHENFGMTVAESLAVETPVISTKGAPWAGLEAHGCGLWVQHGPDAIANALRQLISLPGDERRKMGVRGRAWMQRDFGWDGVAAKMCDVYSWQLARQDRPEWVWI